jgi:hypothetical protein
MIKKFIGVIVTLAVLALIVFVALGASSYSSMLPEGWLDRGVELSSPAQVEVVE